MEVIDRHDDLSLSHGRGHFVVFFSGLMVCWAFKSKLGFKIDGLGPSPLGETGEGFVGHLPVGEGMELSSFLCDGGVEFPSQCFG